MLGHRLCTYSPVLHTAKQFSKVLYQLTFPPVVYESSLLYILAKYSIMCFFIFCLYFKFKKLALGLYDKQWGIIKFIATVIIPWILIYASDSEWCHIELQTLFNCCQNQSLCVHGKSYKSLRFLHLKSWLFQASNSRPPSFCPQEVQVRTNKKYL